MLLLISPETLLWPLPLQTKEVMAQGRQIGQRKSRVDLSVRQNHGDRARSIRRMLSWRLAATTVAESFTCRFVVSRLSGAHRRLAGDQRDSNRVFAG